MYKNKLTKIHLNMICSKCNTNLPQNIPEFCNHVNNCHDIKLTYSISSTEKYICEYYDPKKEKTFCICCQSFLKYIGKHRKTAKHQRNESIMKTHIKSGKKTNKRTINNSQEWFIETSKSISPLRDPEFEEILRDVYENYNFKKKTNEYRMKFHIIDGMKLVSFNCTFSSNEKDVIKYYRATGSINFVLYPKIKETVLISTDYLLSRLPSSYHKDILSDTRDKKIPEYTYELKDSPLDDELVIRYYNDFNLNQILKSFRLKNVGKEPKITNYQKINHWKQNLKFENSIELYKALYPDAKIVRRIVYHGYYDRFLLNSIIQDGYIEPLLSEKAIYGRGSYFASNPAYSYYLGYCAMKDETTSELLAFEIWYDETKLSVGKRDTVKHYDPVNRGTVNVLCDKTINPLIFCVQNQDNQRIVGKFSLSTM